MILNLLTTANRVDDPRQILAQMLIFNERPASVISAKLVDAFIAHVINPDADLVQDFESLRDTPATDNTTVNAIRWIYFATQKSHLFGWFRAGGFYMEKHYPMSTYSALNVPCPYIWLNLSTLSWEVVMLKHSLPETMDRLRVAVTYPGDFGTARFVFMLQHCRRTVTSVQSELCVWLDADEQSLSCRLSSVATETTVPFVLLLSVELRYSQTLLFTADGRCSVQTAFLHSLL